MRHVLCGCKITRSPDQYISILNIYREALTGSAMSSVQMLSNITLLSQGCALEMAPCVVIVLTGKTYIPRTEEEIKGVSSCPDVALGSTNHHIFSMTSSNKCKNSVYESLQSKQEDLIESSSWGGGKFSPSGSRLSAEPFLSEVAFELRWEG